jgi:hypothetical protein
MATKKSMWILFGIFVIAFWVLGSVIQAGAETLNYKWFNHITKNEAILIPDAEGHNVSLFVREGVIYILA